MYIQESCSSQMMSVRHRDAYAAQCERIKEEKKERSRIMKRERKKKQSKKKRSWEKEKKERDRNS